MFRCSPAAIVVPRLHSRIGLFGNYCSWNCAKRGLLGLRNRPWYALLAITAIKTGATLPIRLSEKGKPPPQNETQIVKQIPSSLTVEIVKYISIPHIYPDSASTDSEPEVFESIIQASFEI
jgi:hypothetical protein